MKLRAILDRIDALKAEIDALRPIDAEQEARVRQMLRIDWNYHRRLSVFHTFLPKEYQP